MLALVLTENYFADNNIKGAYRIHGGGFAGTILVFIENNRAEGYITYIESVLGTGSVSALRIVNEGARSIS